MAARSRSTSVNRWNIVHAASPSCGTGSNDAVSGSSGGESSTTDDPRGRAAVVQRGRQRLAHPPLDGVGTQRPRGGLLRRQRHRRDDVPDAGGQALHLASGVEAETGGVAEATVLLADPGARGEVEGPGAGTGHHAHALGHHHPFLPATP